MWAIGVYDFGLTDEEFWEINPTQFNALSERHDQRNRQEDYRMAVVASTIANANRDPKTPAIKPTDFLPSYEDEKEEEKPVEMSADTMLAALKKAFPQRKPKVHTPRPPRSKRGMPPEAHGG